MMNTAAIVPVLPSVADVSVPLKLVQVHLLFRHGDRAPTEMQNSSNSTVELWASRLEENPFSLPTRNYVFQQHPFGQLTKKGAEQARNFGRWIKQRYVDSLLLSLEDPSFSIKARSTNYQRTHLTGWCVLEGLLGSSDAAKAIPIQICDEKDENLLSNCQQYPCLEKLWKDAWKNKLGTCYPLDGESSSGWSARFQDFKELLQTFLKLESSGKTEFRWLVAVDTVLCNWYHGDLIPKGIEEKLSEVRNLISGDYTKTFQDRVICRLNSGSIVKEITDQLLWCADEDNKERPPKLFLYAGHDGTLVPLSVCLGVPWKGWPSYLSSIALELWKAKDSDKHFVQVLYDGQPIALPVSMECLQDMWNNQNQSNAHRTHLCTLEEFQRLAKLSSISKEEHSLVCEEAIHEEK